MVSLLSQIRPLLPEEKPVHLLGIGDEISLERTIPLGIDTFDSAFPTKAARHGLIFTRFILIDSKQPSRGPIRINKAEYLHENVPLDSDCDCYTYTKQFSIN